MDLQQPHKPDTHRRRRLTAGLTTLVAVGLAGCVSPGSPGVGIKAISADIVFGQVPKVKPSLPSSPIDAPLPELPIQVVETADGSQLLVPADEPLPLVEKPAPKPGRDLRQAVECRKATVNDFAPESAPFNASQAPTSGIYKWKYEGAVLTSAGATRPTSVKGFTERTVSDVTVASPTRWEYSVTGKDAFNNTVTERYRVRTDAVNRITNLNVGVSTDPAGNVRSIAEIFVGEDGVPTAPEPAAGTINAAGRQLTSLTLSTGEPDRGLSLLARKVQAPNGTTISDVAYTVPLLLLPLPVTPGYSWQSTAVDSKDLNSTQVFGQVSRQTETDACGSPVQGWRAELAFTASNGETSTSSDMILHIATQYGGLPILERTGRPDAPLFLEYSLAAPLPRPLG